MSVRNHVPRLVVVATVVLGLTACGNGGDETAASTTTTTSEPTTSTESTTTTSEPTTSTASTTTTTSEPTTVAPDACPAGQELPPDATNPMAITVDLDLNGVDEDVRTYFTPGEGRWRIRVEWDDGGATDQAIDDSSGGAPARPIGPYDVDGDGTPELFTIVGSGAATVLVGLYDVAGCELTRVTRGGKEASFPVGATVQHVSGLSCGPVGDLDRLFADFVADDTFEGGVEPFTLSGSELTAGFGDGATFTPEEAGALAVFDCGDLQL